MHTLEKPEAWDSMTDDVDEKIYIEDVKEYRKDKRVLTRSAKTLYSLVLGQFTETLREKMKGKEEPQKIDEKRNLVDLLKMMKEIEFKVDTGKNIYITTYKFKRESANLFQNNETPERYLEKFLINVQVAKHRECGIWLDKGPIMSELKITKSSNITWDTATSADLEKAGEVTKEKMKAMVFIQHSSRQYNGLQREMGKKCAKRKGLVPDNGEIGIQPDTGMIDGTWFNAGRVSAMRKSPRINGTQRPGQHQ